MALFTLTVSSISLDDMPAPGPGQSSPVSVLDNSPFYSPVRERDRERASPSQAATSTFSTFLPQARTSPEGSSCGDTDLEQQARGQHYLSISVRGKQIKQNTILRFLQLTVCTLNFCTDPAVVIYILLTKKN